MAIQQAFKGKITLAFDYKENENSKPKRYEIANQKIAYVMIEKKYENVNILPVLYVSLNLDSDLYTKVINSINTSKFYLNIKKKNALSRSSIYDEEVNDTFSYVTPTTTPNYSKDLNTSISAANTAYVNVLIGLVSDTMSNTLRKSFDGFYHNIKVSDLVNLATKDMGRDLIMKPVEQDKTYKSYMITPVPSRYKLLMNIFSKFPFYNSMFEFFMDFKHSYLLSRNNEPVDAKDGKPSRVIINIKSYTATEAYLDGFTIKNGAYLIYVNAANTKLIVDTVSSKVSNNIINYSDSVQDIQDYNINISKSEETQQKTTFTRTLNGAALKNEMQSNAVMVELVKQNLDSDIFTPNKIYSISNFDGYEQYNGDYRLSYIREFYYLADNDEYLATCNVGLKLVGNEEVATSKTDTTSRSQTVAGAKKKKSSSNRVLNTVVKANRTKTNTTNKYSGNVNQRNKK